MASRINHIVLLGIACLCAAALTSSGAIPVAAAESDPARPVVAGTFPIASDVRLAGDAKQTRFILDLDKKIDVHAFRSPIPIELSSIPRRSTSSFRLVSALPGED